MTPLLASRRRLLPMPIWRVRLGLVIIPVINKIDLPYARVEETKDEIVSFLRCKKEDILEVSAKTGQGVSHLLEEIVRRVPPASSR